MRKIKIVLLVVAVILLLGAFYGIHLYKGYRGFLEQIYTAEESESGIDETESREPVETIVQPAKEEPFALIVAGISLRQSLGDMGLPDTIMLALVNPETGKVNLISIPRDTYVDIPGFGHDKINSTYALGGMDLLTKTTQKWLGIRIRGYVSLNFEAFVDLVDLLGGIEVEIKRNMEYDDPIDGTKIRLSPGRKQLDGKNTLDFVRFRKSNDGNHASDYDRMERQQEVVFALYKKALSIRTFSKIKVMMDILGENIKTTLSPSETEGLIRKFIHFSDIQLDTTSIIGQGHLIDSIWYEVISREEMERITTLIREFMG